MQHSEWMSERVSECAQRSMTRQIATSAAAAAAVKHCHCPVGTVCSLQLLSTVAQSSKPIAIVLGLLSSHSFFFFFNQLQLLQWTSPSLVQRSRTTLAWQCFASRVRHPHFLHPVFLSLVHAVVVAEARRTFSPLLLHLLLPPCVALLSKQTITFTPVFNIVFKAFCCVVSLSPRDWCRHLCCLLSTVCDAVLSNLISCSPLLLLIFILFWFDLIFTALFWLLLCTCCFPLLTSAMFGKCCTCLIWRLFCFFPTFCMFDWRFYYLSFASSFFSPTSLPHHLLCGRFLLFFIYLLCCSCFFILTPIDQLLIY